jgi:hypothetical protein
MKGREPASRVESVGRTLPVERFKFLAFHAIAARTSVRSRFSSKARV